VVFGQFKIALFFLFFKTGIKIQKFRLEEEVLKSLNILLSFIKPVEPFSVLFILKKI